MDWVRKAATAIAPETIATRRDFHRHPETAFEEFRTSEKVAEKLRSLGLDFRARVGGTGVVAVIEGNGSGRTVIARADMDALPISESTTAEYRSIFEGKMHACGHDGHTAVLLSVADVLARARNEFRGKVVLIFQPAEEIGRGAQAMLDDGALDGSDPDAAVTLHLTSTLPTGELSVRAGPGMAATDSFEMAILGSGGHAAKPHETIDPISVAAQISLSVQALVSREVNPLEPALAAVTSVHGGTAHNIVPGSVELKGTVRTFDAETRNRLKARIGAIAAGIAGSQGATVTMRWSEGAPAVVNDAELTDKVRKVLGNVAGEGSVSEMPQMLGGDDMSIWFQHVPGCYFLVGSRGGEATAYPNHHPRFDIDEAALPLAVESLSKSVLALLKK